MRSRQPGTRRTAFSLRTSVLCALLLFAGLCAALAVTTAPESRGSLSTPERLRLSAWWPTKSADPGLYVGTATCAQCHAGIVRQQAKSQMFRTFGSAGNSTVLAHDQPGTYRNGDYSYQAALAGHAAVMDVNDGHGKQQRADLKWFFGSGDVGQSFLWQDADGFHETRFNYFRSINALAATPGRLSAPPTYFAMAVGRSVEPFEVRSCLSCHTTQYPPADRSPTPTWLAGSSAKPATDPAQPTSPLPASTAPKLPEMITLELPEAIRPPPGTAKSSTWPGSPRPMPSTAAEPATAHRPTSA